MTLEEKVIQGEWWTEQEPILNLEDINKPPVYYRKNGWKWIEELTAYIFREPTVWQDIYRAYVVKARKRGNLRRITLNYYRNEEGYIRKVGMDEAYLLVRMEAEGIISLKSVGDWLCRENEIVRRKCIAYGSMAPDERVQWLEEMENLIKERFPGVSRVRMACGLEESGFEKREVFYDFLNAVYIIL